MYNALASGRASLATVVRIILTASLRRQFFVHMEPLDQYAAIVCLSLPVALEVGALCPSGQAVHTEPSAHNGSPISKKTLIKFNLPLSVSGYLLSFSAMLLSAFIARAADPERMLPAYYLALGLATPLAYGTTRLQEVVLTFHPRHERPLRSWRLPFALARSWGCFRCCSHCPDWPSFILYAFKTLPPVI